MTPLPPSQPPPPTSTPTFSLRELDAGMVEFSVRVERNGRYRVVTWNEGETPEIRRCFDEMVAAQQQLEAQGQ